jgi:hypothetical protein
VRSRACGSPLRSAAPSRLALPLSPTPPVGDLLESGHRGGRLSLALVLTIGVVLGRGHKPRDYWLPRVISRSTFQVMGRSRSPRRSLRLKAGATSCGGLLPVIGTAGSQSRRWPSTETARSRRNSSSTQQVIALPIWVGCSSRSLLRRQVRLPRSNSLTRRRITACAERPWMLFHSAKPDLPCDRTSCGPSR